MINNNVFTKTRRKLIFNIMLVVETFMILMSVFIFSYFKMTALKNIDVALLDEYMFISREFTKESIMDPISLQDPKDIVYIYSDDEIRYYTINRYFDKKIPKKIDRYGYFNEEYGGYNFRTANIKHGEYTFRIMRNIDSEMDSLSNLVVLLIMSDIAALLPVFVIARFLSKKALKPIENSWNNQVKFVQDASHELRTPISIIQSKLEYLLRSPDSTIESEAETVAVAMRETRQLKKMISELLSLTKEESIVKLNYEIFSLEDLFEEIAESYSEIAEYQEKKFYFEVDSKNKNINSDRSKLNQLIRILIDNAFKYTDKGDEISIKAVSKNWDRVVIEVRDTGIGISQKDQRHIFERFFRSDSVRATEIEGSGIGLSIAKIISKTLKATLRVKSRLGEGTSFTIDIARGKVSK